MSKLLPCPFCGFEALMFRDFESDDGVHHRIRCANRSCRAEQCLQADHDDFISKHRAIDAWNARAPVAASGCGPCGMGPSDESTALDGKVEG